MDMSYREFYRAAERSFNHQRSWMSAAVTSDKMFDVIDEIRVTDCPTYFGDTMNDDNDASSWLLLMLAEETAYDDL